MGRVYRAEQKALGRTVAVKIIHPHLLDDESASVRFITEARAASRLNHPNSVGVIDFGKADSQLYLVMEFLRGRDLARVVYEEGALPFKRIVDVLCQVLAALSEAHHLGIIHRDLKPENIILERLRSGGDFVKVVDFGLAKIMADINTTNITSPGIVCGTPDYMAPEQGRGDPLDQRSDLYACGVILFQLLTGRLPFEAETPTQVVLMHLSMPAPNPAAVAPEREIPEELVEVTLRALEKEASKRYQTAEELADALRASLAASETASNRISLVEVGVACTNCGAMMPRGQRFCGDCGSRIGTQSPPKLDATRASQERPRISSLPRVPVPFTGREEDLAWLDSRRTEVRGGLMAVRLVGEPGVGKTRLVREVLARAAAEGDIVVQTGPDPWWAEVGNYALRKAITELARLPPGGGDTADWNGATAEARRGLVDLFGRRTTGRETRSPFWSRRVAPGALSAEARRFITAEALRWAISRACQNPSQSRVLLAIDDLHAVDGGSQTAFADVIAEPPLCTLMILGTHAPTFDPQWSGPVRMLQGLPTAVAASLVKGVAAPRSPPGGGDNPTVPPLYIDQLIRFNTEGGSDPPARMADLIALRIERLPIEARRTLQAVAVIGDAADLESLHCLLPDLASFDEHLSTLAVAGFIEQRPNGISTTHPLVRDVTLATIPAAVRRDLHGKAAADIHGDPLPLPLEVQALHAYHAQNAFEALMLLEQVAERASARGDQAGCVLALRRGLDLARREIFRGELDDPMRAVLIFARKLGEALASAGDLPDAEGALREALDLAGPSSKDRAMVLGSLAFVARERDRAADAAAFLREAIDLAKQAAANELVSSLEGMRREWLSG
jgi:serine/threonine-protein kinase